INLAHSARAVLRKDKEENRDNVVHFQDFMKQSLRKNALAECAKLMGPEPRAYIVRKAKSFQLDSKASDC
ncbi:MAG: hypothetical protein OIF54_06470, partial [Cohaesibacter sp.]|nr:hypothetical protein [Cohaesibacter sp.]